MSEIKKCKDPYCEGEMKIITSGESAYGGNHSYCYNLYICSECDSICKEDLWHNSGQLWIMINGRIHHYTEEGLDVLNYRPPGFPSEQEEKESEESLRILSINANTSDLDHIEKYLKIIPRDHYQREDLERRVEELKKSLAHLHSQTI